MTTPQQSQTGAAGSHDASAVPLALFLWAVVVVALAYGVMSTLSKVVELFG
jgi:hypothetical protein